MNQLDYEPGVMVEVEAPHREDVYMEHQQLC